MLGKSTKKDSIHLKFDTSSDNLACFIRSNSKIANENGCNDRQARSNRKKIKSK